MQTLISRAWCLLNGWRLVEHWAQESSRSSSATARQARLEQGELCPLNRVQAGSSVRIKRITADGHVGQRLRELGFGEEQTIKLVNSQTTVICLVCNTRLAISVELAEGILVEPLPG